MLAVEPWEPQLRFLEHLERVDMAARSTTTEVRRFELEPYGWREAEKALERWTDLHDEGCDCGACLLLAQLRYEIPAEDADKYVLVPREDLHIVVMGGAYNQKHLEASVEILRMHLDGRMDPTRPEPD